MNELQTILRSKALGAGYRIGYLSNVFSGPVYKVAEKEYGIHRPMFATLFCVSHMDNLSATDVCGMTGIGKNTISRAIARLEKKACLKRRPDPDDSRSALLEVTPAGRRIFETILPLLQAREKAMLGTLTRAEQKQLFALFDKLIARDDGCRSRHTHGPSDTH